MANPRQPASTSAAQPVLGPAASIPKRRPFWPLWVVGLLTLLMVLTLLLRTWALNSTPPGLWWDEATQGTDAWTLLHGQFSVFFPSAEGKEPLYVYLTTPFVAVWNGQPFAVRLAGALLGVLMVPALYITARSLWREHPTAGLWAGLTAAGLWAVNFWPQSINRIGFQVNAFPIVMTLSVATWVNWAFGRPTRKRAFVFGLLAGLTLATYLAARFSPVLWVILFLLLPAQKRRRMRSGIPWALLGFALTAVPLALHFVLHWQDFTSRTSVFPLLNGEYAGRAMLEALWFNFKMIAGGFLGWAGDPVLRHNIPNRPAFSPVTAVLVALGLGAALFSLRRRSDPRGWTLLGWVVLLSLPGLLSLASNPHFPRLFGVLPAVLLLAAWPVASLAGALAKRSVWLRAAAIAGLVVLLAVEGGRTAQAYFGTWRQLDLYEAFQVDFSLLGQHIRATPDAIAVVPMNTEAGLVLDYTLRDAAVHQVQVDEATIGGWLAGTLREAGGREVIVPVWNQGPNVYGDPKRVVPFYLKREGQEIGEEPQRNFDILTFKLGDHPAFEALGQLGEIDRPFSPSVRLVGARWGAAYPNSDRNSATVAAGTPVWVILDWQLEEPLATLRTSVDLVDGAGHRLDTSDEYLLRLEETPAAWPPGSIVRTHHLVTAPVTQLPGPMTLQVRLYDSETLTPIRPAGGTPDGGVVIGEAQVIAPQASPDATAPSPALPLHVEFPGGVTLLGMDRYAETAAPGLPLTLRLYWQLADPLVAEQRFSLALGDTGIRAEGRLPINTPVGLPMHTFVDLRLPPDAEPGNYPLVLSLENSAAPPAILGQVQVQGRARRFEAPPSLVPATATFGDTITLLGVLEPVAGKAGLEPLRIAPGQPITVTLVWQAQTTPTADLVRFVHLLDEHAEAPLAQNDGRPCAGECPSASWIPGEVLEDPVRLTLPADLPPGTYRLGVGWYDAATPLDRLPAYDGSGRAMPYGVYTLPFDVMVAP